MDIYERHGASIEDWVKSYQKAKEIMDYSPNLDLSFEKSGELVYVMVPIGRIGVMDKGICINVNPYLIEVDTSENLRQFIYSHELKEIETSSSPISVLFGFTNFFGEFFSPLSYKREIYVNRRAYDSLCKKTNPICASERMHKFVEEWLDLRPENYGDINGYVRKCMPFLNAKPTHLPHT